MQPSAKVTDRRALQKMGEGENNIRRRDVFLFLIEKKRGKEPNVYMKSELAG